MQELDYAYDNIGNVKNINDTNNKRRFLMNYDDLDRLIWTEINNYSSGEDKNLNYTYNSIGNMLNISLYDGTNLENITFFYHDTKVHALSNMNTSSFTPNDTHKFIIKDSSDNSVAWLGNEGNIVLKGQCYSGSNCNSPGDSSLIIRNSSGDNVAYINSTGDLCLTSGSCNDNYNSCNNAGDGSFIIRNSSDNNISYLNSAGALCLTRTLYQNSDAGAEAGLSLTNKDITYDSNGNMINDGNKTYEYDEFNRMIKVKNSTGSLISEYIYDHKDNRVKKIEYEDEGNTTTYYIGDAFIRITNSSGDYNQTYYYDNEKLIAENNSNNELIYYHPDHLGSTTLITSSAGNLVEETFYLPFGEVIDGGSSRNTFTGQESDGETGLMYYSSRYYDPVLRHFVQADPIIGDLYNPQDLNHYAYVRNNPYFYVDESGNVAVVSTLIVAASAGAVIGGGAYLVNVAIGGQEFSASGLASNTLGGAVGATVGTAAVLAAPFVAAAAGGSTLAGTGTVLTGGALGAISSQSITNIGTDRPINEGLISSGIFGSVSAGIGTKFPKSGFQRIKYLNSYYTTKTGQRFLRNVFGQEIINVGLDTAYSINQNSAQNAEISLSERSSQTSSGSKSGGGGSGSSSRFGERILGGGTCGVTASCA